MQRADQTGDRTGTIPELALDIVDFWREAGPDKWFAKDDEFDALFTSRFRDAHFRAARREFEDWLQAAESALALMILLDQYPRNAFRDTGHMFATDGLALHYARRALAAGFLEQVEPAMRNFLCLPFMHAEDLAVQEESLALYTKYAPDSMYWAEDHHAIIKRFGRFPHRNVALGRETTDEERAFLDGGGFAG